MEDGILPIGSVIGVGSGYCGGRLGLEELFGVAKLCGGEVGEFGVVGGELLDDFFFIGGSYRDVVEVAVELVQHCVLAGK